MTCLDKLVVNHELNAAQTEFLGIGVAHCSAAFYTFCYGVFSLVMGRLAEAESGHQGFYLSFIYIAFGLWYLMLGGMALSVTGKNPPLCPIRAGCGLSVVTLKMIAGAAIVTGLDLSGLMHSSEGLLTSRYMVDICPKGVFQAATGLLMFFHVAEFLMVWIQLCAVSRLKIATSSQITFVPRRTGTSSGYSQFVNPTNDATGNIRPHNNRNGNRNGLERFQAVVPPNCEVIQVATTSTVQYD